MMQVIVTRVWVLKKSGGSEHESLVIKAKDLEGHGEAFYLRFKCGPCGRERAMDISTPPSPKLVGLSPGESFLSASPSLASVSVLSEGSMSAPSERSCKSRLSNILTESKWKRSLIASAPTASHSSKSAHLTFSLQ